MPIRTPLEQEQNQHDPLWGTPKGIMTRDFNKQRRDDMRPSPREQSSSRYENERSPRPARPRLHRESVDHAWESGAPTRHADYRTRGSNDNRRQAPRTSWHDKQQHDEFGRNREDGHYQARNTRPSFGNRSYEGRSGDRPARPRRFDDADTGSRGSHTYQRPPSRSFNDERPERPYRQSRPYGNDRPGSAARGNGPRPAYREQSRPYGSRPPYRSNEQENGFQRRNANFRGRDERGPRQFERPYRQEANDFDGRPPRNFNRDRYDRRGTGEPENTSRNAHSPRDREAYDTRNPRWQSRSFAQREQGYQRERNDVEFRVGREHYEGDYERFTTSEERPRHSERSPQRYEKSRPRRDEGNRREPEADERHVTPLPDGRILKGPRQVQRKNAEFWTDIAQNTDTLLEGVKDAPAQQETGESTVAQELPTSEHAVQKKDASSVRSKPRNRATTAAARSKIASKKRAKMNGALPRPSKRGYKWPTP